MRQLPCTATIAALLTIASLQPLAAGDVKAIETGRKGDLTMCPMWTFSCNLYHHISLPARITVGDKVPVNFGSNPKEYNFPVARIVMHINGGCTVFSQLTKAKDIQKIEVPSCRVVPEPR
jgi:hypothetical protein